MLTKRSLCSLTIFKYYLFSHILCYVVLMIENKCEHIVIECAWYNFMSTWKEAPEVNI